MAKAKSKAMGPALKRFLKKRGRFPKGPKERREAGIMTKADKARSRSPKGKPGKKPARSKASRTSPKKQGGKPRMARRKSSLVNRVINAGLLALAFMPAITRALAGNFQDIVRLYTFDLINGKFNKAFALEALGPIGASFILFEVKKMAMKKFRF